MQRDKICCGRALFGGLYLFTENKAFVGARGYTGGICSFLSLLAAATDGTRLFKELIRIMVIEKAKSIRVINRKNFGLSFIAISISNVNIFCIGYELVLGSWSFKDCKITKKIVHKEIG
jgi:hypothetical protein